ncbi:MAG: chorismate mutase [Kiritimatiellae bacterium]|nr:chorismate mutase [Kiritimatiellia bacterium]
MEEKKLDEIRKEINNIDKDLLRLFVRRLEIVQDVAESKKARGLPVFDPVREREILSRVAGEVGPDLENEVSLFFSTMFSISRSRQREALSPEVSLRKEIEAALEKAPENFPSRAPIACQGVEGAYSQQAASILFKFPTILYFNSFEDVFSAVEKGLCKYGILPIENSAAGSVTSVYDIMAKHNFKIVKALRLRIRHVLLAPPGVKMEDIKEVTSHPHAIAQCTNFFKAHPDIKANPYTNTAAAAKDLASSQRKDLAVIASRSCAELYGLNVIAEDICDVQSNYTRFICISKETEIYHDAKKFSIVMSLAHRPGSLCGVMSKFASIGVNLTKLESRPVPGSDFEFMFIFDFEASPRDPRVLKLLSGFANDTSIEHFTFLGAYAED